jgi:hypothetical protein
MIAKGGRTNDNSGLKKLTPELRKGLTDFADENNLSARELAQLYNMIAIQKFIMECHTIPITQNKTNRRRYTRLPSGKQVVKTTLEDSKLTSNARKPSKERRLRHLPSMSVTKV